MKDEDLWIYAGSAKTTDAKDKQPVELHAPAGNMFWADDQSGQDLDIQFAVNGKLSPSLPKEFTPKATLIPNTAEETCNSLELYINGKGYPILDNIPTEHIKAPGDLRAAIMTCPPQPQKTLITPNNNESENEVITILKASASLVLPANLFEDIFDVDEVSEEIISAIYDTLADNAVLEFYDHLSDSNRDQNATATIMVQAVDHGTAYAYYKNKYGAEGARAYLKEFIVQGKFSIKRMSQWGNKLGIVFKGDRANRTFLTGINYGVNNDKVQMVSSVIQMAGDLDSTDWWNFTKSTLKSANPLKGTNIISFVFATSFDVYEFFTKDIGEQNIAEFLGALGVTTAKLFISGIITTIIISFIKFGLVIMGGVTLSTVIFLFTVAGISFLVGWGVDLIDQDKNIKDNIKTFLKKAFPQLTIENIINKDLDREQSKVNNYIGSSAMNNSSFLVF